MVAIGQHVDAKREHFLGRFARQAKARGEVLSVGDGKVDAVLIDQARQMSQSLIGLLRR